MKKTVLILMCVLLFGATVSSETQRLQSIPKYRIKTRSLTLAPVLLHVDNESVTIEWEQAMDVVDISIESIDGIVVYSSSLNTNETNILTIDVQNWSNGTYYIEIDTEDAVISGDFEL